MDRDVQISSLFPSSPIKKSHGYHDTKRNCGLQDIVVNQGSSYINGFSGEGILATEMTCGKVQAPSTLVSRLGVETASLGDPNSTAVSCWKDECI